ncbi:uncharacterized serine-rich protein C215.13-like [Jatropha curcas]|uniref:uncharacterized serine-rich protein C215.13-like n=1 Tax=Jatropha curcas TaxID=180498 RepID=UPI001892F49C|nr:uncharacterized serine-rich protein C215.13-like [Jatropha curcas]
MSGLAPSSSWYDYCTDNIPNYQTVPFRPSHKSSSMDNTVLSQVNPSLPPFQLPFSTTRVPNLSSSPAHTPSLSNSQSAQSSNSLVSSPSSSFAAEDNQSPSISQSVQSRESHDSQVSSSLSSTEVSSSQSSSLMSESGSSTLPIRTHPMTTRSQNNIFKPKILHSVTKHPLSESEEPTRVSLALKIPVWHQAMSPFYQLQMSFTNFGRSLLM